MRELEAEIKSNIEQDEARAAAAAAAAANEEERKNAASTLRSELAALKDALGKEREEAKASMARPR